MTTTITLTGLKTTIYAEEGMDEVLKQVLAVSADCWIEGGKVVKVVVPDGIVFAGPSGSLVRPDGYNVTYMCDLAAIAKQIADDQEERDEMLMDAHML